jgi:hypothetical protein
VLAPTAPAFAPILTIRRFDGPGCTQPRPGSEQAAVDAPDYSAFTAVRPGESIVVEAPVDNGFAMSFVTWVSHQPFALTTIS